MKLKSLFGVIAGCAILALAAGIDIGELQQARDKQDLAAMDRLIAQAQQTVRASGGAAEAEYRLGLAYSYAAETAMELHDKRRSQTYAEAGMEPAKKALDANQGNAEYHRLVGELCGQVIPANPLMGALKYGQCARDEINKAIELDGKLALAYVSRGVGNYYLPQAMGGGLDLALKDVDKAIQLNPNMADAYLWKGIILRKANKDAEARQALEQALKLDPNRAWAKEQLAKTPAH